MKLPKMLPFYLSLAAALLLVIYRGVQIYKAVKAPTSTTAAPAPTSQKVSYTLSVTREVVVEEKK